MKLFERLLALFVCAMTIIVLYLIFRSEKNYMQLKDKFEEITKLNSEFIEYIQSDIKNTTEENEASLESSIGETTPTATFTNTSLAHRENKFKDLQKYSVYNPHFRSLVEWPPYVTLSPTNPRVADILGLEIEPTRYNWEKFNLQISKLYLYEKDSKVIEDLLHDMATDKIVAVEQMGAGMQLKLLITFENGGHALFKPQRYPREKDVSPNVLYYSDFERHVSEIAAFHLDRIFDFRRAPPVVGRKVNITSELYPLADEEFVNTFFYSPDGNYCFHGICKLYCDTHHSFCGDPDMIEGSLAAWIVPKPLHFIRSPWRRTYHFLVEAPWETDPYYCIDAVRDMPPFDDGRRIYDAMDCAILDYLIGNMDRHHYNELLIFGNDSTSNMIHIDNGRGFGQADRDEESILTPLLQCCVLRLSTFNKLYSFHAGPKPLSELMRESLSRDPLTPVLTEPHLRALDRRVDVVLAGIRSCLDANLPSEVFLDDLL